MSSHPALPIELVEEIIDNLRNDLPALSNCALVCRAWLPRAHFHRFADISLSISSLVRGGSRRDKLHEIVGHNASLLLHIHSLHLHAVNILGSSVSWHRVRKTPPLCPGLVTLRSLSLSQFEVCTLTELLPTICALPVLEDLVLDRIRVHPCRSPSHIEHVGPARQVRACRSLKALRFIGEAIGESILEAESSRFASNLMETGALRPESIESLALLSGARACAGWVPLLPSMATSLQHCAVSLHELCVHGELAESARKSSPRLARDVAGLTYAPDGLQVNTSCTCTTPYVLAPSFVRCASSIIRRARSCSASSKAPPTRSRAHRRSSSTPSAI